MNSQPLHQNLDTSYVNLSALIRYLRKRQFVGSVKIQLNGYYAIVRLNANNRLDVREEDRISGRISTGKEAFKRLLIRSREPGGSINVDQLKAAKKKSNAGAAEQKNPVSKPRVRTQVATAPSLATSRANQVTNGNRMPKVPSNGKGKPVRAKKAAVQTVRDEFIPIDEVSRPESAAKDKPSHQTSLPDFPFELTNKVERKARRRQLATEDWQTLLKLTVELLGVVDRSLENHRLDFTAAFRKACAEISSDYPFMSPASKVFDYEKGRVTMNKQVNEAVFVNSIAESLGRIVERLGQSPKFETVYRDTNHLIIALINKRKKAYDRFGFRIPLERIVRHRSI